MFAGFRVVEIADNVIKRISRVPIERLEQSGWTLDWDAARAPIEVTRAPEPPWLTVSEGATTPGARDECGGGRRPGRRCSWPTPAAASSPPAVRARRLGRLVPGLRGQHRPGRHGDRGRRHRRRGPPGPGRRGRRGVRRARIRHELGRLGQRLPGSHDARCADHRRTGDRRAAQPLRRGPGRRRLHLPRRGRRLGAVVVGLPRRHHAGRPGHRGHRRRRLDPACSWPTSAAASSPAAATARAGVAGPAFRRAPRSRAAR